MTRLSSLVMIGETYSMLRKTCVALLEVMWDWQARTTSAGYAEQAPRYFEINPGNFTGSRLYSWLGSEYSLMATNACPQLVSSAKGRGKPDKDWVRDNLATLHERTVRGQFDLLLVCGAVAAKTYSFIDARDARIVEVPHPAARGWTRGALFQAGRFIREGSHDLTLEIEAGYLHAYSLVPF